MKRVFLLCLLVVPFWAQAEASDSAVLPLVNLGVAFPTGLETTAGVVFATVAETAQGPSLSLRIDGFGPRWGVSAGPGWVEEIDWGGYGANLWFSQDLLNGVPDGNALGLEAYIRLLLLEFRVGVRGSFGGAYQQGVAVLPVVGINFGI